MKTQKSQNLVRTVNKSGIKILVGTLLLFSISAATSGLYYTDTTSAKTPDG